MLILSEMLLNHPEIKEFARLMQAELETSRLCVTLAPSLLGEGKIRVVDQHNPAWYSAFCEQYTAGRSKPRKKQKHDTLIKRANTLNALGKIARGDGDGQGGCYVSRLLPVVLDECIRCHEQWGTEHVVGDLIRLRGAV